MLIPIDASGYHGRNTETRAGGVEDLIIDISLDFIKPTSFEISAHIDINSLMIKGNNTSSDELRAIYELDPSGISLDIANEVNKRVDDIINLSFEGDILVLSGSVLDEDSLRNTSENAGMPVGYDLYFSGATPVEDFLPQDRAEELEGEEPDDVVSALLSSGFTYTRNINLRAKMGQMVTYRIPSSYDPYGDGSFEIDIINTMSADQNGDYVIVVDATSGDSQKWFLMEITGHTRVRPDGENMEGVINIDWFRLDMMTLEADIEVLSINAGETALPGLMPDTITTPNFVGSGLIRYLRHVGLVKDEDIEDKRSDISDEVELEIESSLDMAEPHCTTSVNWNIEGMVDPADGGDLLEILRSATPLEFICTSDDDLTLDILDGYQLDDVMGLLNGGLRIKREFTVDSTDDYVIRLLLPENLTLIGETSTDAEGGRSRYTLTSGTKRIGSTLAPEYTQDSVSLDAFVDLSGFRSHYVADASMEFHVETSVLIEHLWFDSSKYEVNTTLDFELDYLTADLIRLLIEMDIADRQQIEDELEKQHDEIMGDISDDPDIVSTLKFKEGTLDFDDDHGNMTGDDPIVITFKLDGEVDTGDLLSGGGGSCMEARVLPFHFDPILPIRTIERTFDLGDETAWDLHLDIRLPTGLSVKGWLGNGSDHKFKELETVVKDGYPTLKVVRENGKGDHILIAIEVGLYLPVNNITCCFVGLVLPVVLIFLLIMIKVVRKARKSKKGEKEQKEGDEDERDDDAETPADPWDVPADKEDNT